MERCYVINKLCLMFCDPLQQGFLATYVILGAEREGPGAI